MLGRLFKQNQSGPNPPNSNGNINYINTNGTSNSYSNGYGANHQPKNGPITNPNTKSYQNVNTFEDSHSREILYGTSDNLQLRPYQLNNKFFRIIISQDGGNLRSKQVLYDSAAQNNDNPSVVARPPPVSRNNSSSNVNSKNILTSKIYHNASELNDYMFGCGLPSNETYSTTKIHILPTLNNLTYGSNQSILVTRLFLISDNDNLNFNDDFESQWKPRPALPIKEISFKNYAFNIANSKANTQDAGSTSKSSNSINSRFSIGLIIPLESVNDDLNDVIFNNWDEVSHYLIVLQKLIIKKLILILNNSVNDLSLSSLSLQNNSPNHAHNYCPYIVNKRIQFPSYLLQNELDLNNQLIKLIKLMHYNSNVPKLINSNSLMRSSMKNSSKENPMLLNWISEVLNWLQFKDGRSMYNDINTQMHSSFNNNSQFQYNHTATSNSLSIQTSQNMNNLNYSPNNDTAVTKTFLASLLALIIPLRKLLTMKPFSNSNDCKNTREVTRVIVMTGNPVVAKKLIFIINGLIPDNEMLSILDDYDGHMLNMSEGSNDAKPVEHSIDKIPEDKSCEEFLDENSFSNDSLSTSSSMQHKLFSSAGDMNNINVLGGAKPVPIRPIPIKSPTVSSYSSSDNSPTHTTSVKGWEIPHKSSASTTTTPFKSRVEVGTSVIPIAQKTPARSSLSKSSSMAYLSSSLTSSLSSSASNYSLSKLGGSFMEKWKNSFNPQQTNPNLSNNQNNILLGLSTENYEFLPPSLGNLSKRNSVHSLRTPSPAIEIDESLHFHNSSNTGMSYNSSSATKMAKAHSMFDINNSTNSTNNNINKRNGIGIIQQEGKQLHTGIKRSNTSLYTPSFGDPCKLRNINDFNRNIIRSKCSIIMQAHVSVGDSIDKTLNINSITEKSGDESDSFNEDESTLTSSTKVNEIAPLIKHRPLFPNVAFAEEFRPEFILQSCPINSKLESQVMTSMKNDLLFYQNNCQFEKVISRTVFVSLRAREIKVIEMNVGDDVNEKAEASPNTHTSSNSGTPSGSPQDFQKPSLQSALTKGIRNNKSDQNEQVRLNSIPFNGAASYKTIIKKIFSPTRNSGDKEVIHAIENTLDEINKLFQSKSNNQKTQTINQDFNEKLTMLMSNILS